MRENPQRYQKLSLKLIRRTGYHLPSGSWTHAYWCPACEELHDFAVEQSFSNNARWSFDGNVTAPSMVPSMNITVGPYPTDDESKPGRIDVCHYFLRAGNIQFLGDCTHAMKGQTVPLPDIPTKAFVYMDEDK